MGINLNDAIYDDCYNWLKKGRKAGKTWDFLKMAGKSNEEGLKTFLAYQENENFWPALSVEEWFKVVESYEKIEKASVITIIPPPEVEIGVKVLFPPNSLDSAWVKYKNNLLRPTKEGGKGFSRASVENIEKSSIDILNRLSLDNGRNVAKKGLVVGNVQSGKTANMGALISMAADYGWNMFIILTGTIENLRQQTQKRFVSDLQSGNVTWLQMNRFGMDATSKLSNFNLADGDRERYLTCCLKQVSRLKKLQEFLNSDEKKKSSVKDINYR